MQALLEQPEGDMPAAGPLTIRDEDGNDMRWHKVAQLLGRKYDRIDPVQALQLLPLQVSLYYHTCFSGPGCHQWFLFMAWTRP